MATSPIPLCLPGSPRSTSSISAAPSHVTYAKQGSGKDEDDGAGLGIVAKFDLNGNFLGRFVSSGGPLNAPWGVAQSPAGFGNFGGDILIGNFGDGTIDAYSLAGVFEGTPLDTTGNPLALDGLWRLKFGNGGNGGSPDVLYFTAGPDGESHGLFGAITPTPQPSTLFLPLGALPAMAWVTRRRNRRDC